MRCTEGHELVEVDNPVRREFRHQRGVVCTASFAKPSKPPEGASPIGRLDAEALESQRAHERDLAQPARPVEDREPVGPYAPTRTPNLDDRAAAAPERFEAGYRQGWRERHVYGTPRYKGLPTLTNRPEGGTELGDYLVEQFGSVGTRLDGLVDVVLRQEQRIVEAIEPIRATTTPQPKLKLSEIRSGLTEGWLAERFDRIDTALAQLTDLFVDSRDEIERIKASAECTIDHSSEPVQMVQFKEAFERGRQQGDADRAQRIQHLLREQFERGRQQGLSERGSTLGAEFDRGKAVGAANREAELLDQGWTPPGAVVDLVSNGLRGNEAATEAGWEAAKMMGAETPYSVVGGIINAAIPHLSGAYIAAAPADRFYREPDAGLATDAEMNAPISDQARRNVIEALKAQVKRRDGAIQRYDDALNMLEVARRPTDYEVWRDALTLSATNVFPIDGTGEAGTFDDDRRAQILADAEFFRHHLINYPTISPAEADQAIDDQIDAITEHEAAADLPAKETPGAEADYPF